MAASPFPEAAVRTLIAPYWKLWLAYMLGRRIETDDSGSTIVCYRWRGHLYMWDFRDGARS